MIPGAMGLQDPGRMMTQTGLSDSGRMLSGTGGLSDSERMLLSSTGLPGESEGGRLNHLQRMYEMRVREAAMLREEMQRSLAQTGGSLPGQNLPNPMSPLTGDAGSAGLVGMGQTNQTPQGLPANLAGSRRLSMESSMRSVPQQAQQQFPNDLYMFSSGGQQQLRQAEESWQNQLALGNPTGISQIPQSQQVGTVPVASLREQRARLLQQALESERAFRAEEELQRLLRRQSGPGGGM